MNSNYTNQYISLNYKAISTVKNLKIIAGSLLASFLAVIAVRCNHLNLSLTLLKTDKQGIILVQLISV